MENATIAKLILMAVFFLEVTIFGSFVSALKCFKNKKVMDLAMTFSGSLFFSIAMIDVIPEAINNFDEYLSKQFKEYQTSSSLNQGKLPLTMIIAMSTLIIVMGIDKIMIGHSHDHEYEISFVAQPRRRDQDHIHHHEQNNNHAGQNANPHGQNDNHHGQQNNHVQDNIQAQTAQQSSEESPEVHNNTEQTRKHSEEINWKPFILQIGMLIHAFFQTLAVGLQKSTMSVLSLAVAILVHKWAEGLTLGLLYKKQGFKRSTIIVMIVVQGLTNVIGLLMGSILMGQGSFVMAFFMSMSAGTFLYISLVQVLQEQFKSLTYGKISMVLVANVFVALIVWFQKYQQAKIEHSL